MHPSGVFTRPCAKMLCILVLIFIAIHNWDFLFGSIAIEKNVKDSYRHTARDHVHRLDSYTARDNVHSFGGLCVGLRLLT